MRFVWLLAWRDLVFRPGKTLASVLGIAVGIATVVSVLVVDHNTLLSQTAGQPQAEPDADLLIQPDVSGERGLDAVRADLLAEPLLSRVTAFASGTLSLATPGGRRVGVELMGLDPGAASDLHAYVVSEGDDLDHASPAPQVLLPLRLAAELGLSVGEEVLLSLPPRSRAPRVRCIDGVMVSEPLPAERADGHGRAAAGRPGASGPDATGADRPAGPTAVHPFLIVGLLAPTRLGYAGNRALTTFGAAQEALGAQASVRFWADVDTAAADLPAIQRQLGDRYVITSPRQSLAGLAPEEKAFRSGVRFCGFLALFLGLYIIFNTMSMSLVERVRSIGLLRAIGTTSGRLLGVFLVEGLVLALLGALFALGLARLIVDVMADLRITTLGFDKPLVISEWPLLPVAAVSLTGVLFCLAGVLYPFLRASRLSVIDALRRGVIELARDPFTGLRRTLLVGLLAVVPVAFVVGAPSDEYVPAPLYEAVLMGFGVVGAAFAVLLLLPGVLGGLAQLFTAPFRGAAAALARSTLVAARHRVFGTVSGLMLVFTAIFLIVSVLESLKSETRDFGSRALAGRLHLRVGGEAAGRIEELRKLEPEFATLRPLDVEVTSSFVVRAVDLRQLSVGSMAGHPDDLISFREDRTIILSTRCADDLGKRPGDFVRLATAASGLEDFLVLAVSDEYGFAPDDRVWGVVSAETMLKSWCLDARLPGGSWVAWTPGLTAERADQLRARAVELLGEQEVLELRRGEEIVAEYVADLDLNFAIFYAILLLTVALAAVGILNAMVIAVMERRREIGLLRVVGLTGSQVGGMLLLESGVLGVLGGLFGLLLGVPLAVVTTRALTSVSHLELAFDLTPRALGAVLGGATLVSLLAVLWPAFRANRLRLSEVVRYE